MLVEKEEQPSMAMKNQQRRTCGPFGDRGLAGQHRSCSEWSSNVLLWNNMKRAPKDNWKRRAKRWNLQLIKENFEQEENYNFDERMREELLLQEKSLKNNLWRVRNLGRSGSCKRKRASPSCWLWCFSSGRPVFSSELVEKFQESQQIREGEQKKNKEGIRKLPEPTSDKML